MTSILAIDPSVSCTGWAFAEIGTRPVTGTIRFAPVGTDDDEIGAEALKWLSARLNEFNPDRVAIEAPIHGGGQRADGGSSAHVLQLLYGLNLILRVGVLLKTGKCTLIVAPSTARKALTGKGTYPKGKAKQAVFDACRALGWVGEDDPYDVSDALAIYVAAAMRIDKGFTASFTPLGQAAEAV